MFVNSYSAYVQAAREGVDNAGHWGIGFEDGNVKMYPSDVRRSFDDLPYAVQDIASAMVYNVGQSEFIDNNWGGIFQMDSWQEMAYYIQGKIEGDILDSEGTPTGFRAESILETWRDQVKTRVDKLVEVLESVASQTSYTVTFKDHDGSVLKTQTVDHGSDAIPPVVPEREGYAFIGWDVGFDNITTDIVVTAYYAIDMENVISALQVASGRETAVKFFECDYIDEGTVDISDAVKLLQCIGKFRDCQDVRQGDSFTNSIGMTFNFIPAGTFMMGSPEDEPGRRSFETQHPVTLTQPYYLQTTEVTQGQWHAVMGSNPSYFSYSSECGDDDCPVEKVSWNDIQTFISELNKLGQGIYRLPTEAEWEYAARSGSTIAFANGDITIIDYGYDPNLDVMGWYIYNSGGKTHPVAQKRPNSWGLYDMHGNVSEWVQDFYGSYPSGAVTDPTGPSTTDPTGPSPGSYRVWRGGSWSHEPWNVRAASRGGVLVDHRSHFIGFRLALTQIP